jgi:hypothetical protein
MPPSTTRIRPKFPRRPRQDQICTLLFVGVGKESRALEFLVKRGDSAELVRFEITPEFAARLRAEAVPQRLGRQFPGRPQIVDATRAPDQFGIPSSMFDDLLKNIVPGTFRSGKP